MYHMHSPASRQNCFSEHNQTARAAAENVSPFATSTVGSKASACCLQIEPRNKGRSAWRLQEGQDRTTCKQVCKHMQRQNNAHILLIHTFKNTHIPNQTHSVQMPLHPWHFTSRIWRSAKRLEWADLGPEYYRYYWSDVIIDLYSFLCWYLVSSNIMYMFYHVLSFC